MGRAPGRGEVGRLKWVIRREGGEGLRRGGEGRSGSSAGNEGKGVVGVGKGEAGRRRGEGRIEGGFCFFFVFFLSGLQGRI